MLVHLRIIDFVLERHVVQNEIVVRIVVAGRQLLGQQTQFVRVRQLAGALLTAGGRVSLFEMPRLLVYVSNAFLQLLQFALLCLLFVLLLRLQLLVVEWQFA